MINWIMSIVILTALGLVLKEVWCGVSLYEFPACAVVITVGCTISAIIGMSMLIYSWMVEKTVAPSCAGGATPR